MQRVARGGGERAARAVALVRLLRERARDDAVPGGRQLGPQLGQPRRRLVQVREHDRQLALALERPLAREALEEHAAERVDVGAAVDLLAADLLGRDVVDRADEAAVAGEAADRRDVPREAEVADVRVLAVGPSATRMLPGFTSRWTSPAACAASSASPAWRTIAHGALGLEPPFAAQQLAQVDAVDVRHREVEHAAVLARGERPHDVRVVERRGELRLAQEALPEPLVVRELGREQLQRDPLPVRVLGEVDGAHRAAREQLPDPEPSDDAAGWTVDAHGSSQP